MTQNKQSVWIKGKEIELVEETTHPTYTVLAVMNKLNELLSALDESESEWDASKLKEGDEYWAINGDGTIWQYRFRESEMNVHTFRLRAGNMYKTEKIAQEAYKRIME